MGRRALRLRQERRKTSACPLPLSPNSVVPPLLTRHPGPTSVGDVGDLAQNEARGSVRREVLQGKATLLTFLYGAAKQVSTYTCLHLRDVFENEK